MEPFARVNFDRRIRLPAHALFVGASMSGKTRLVMRLLSEPELFHPAPSRVLFYYDQFQPEYMRVKEKLGRCGIPMELRRGHNVELDQLTAAPDGGHTILLIDDASEETAASKEIARIATNGRHKGISLWLIWHSLFTRHPTSRIISQNMGLYFFLPSPRLESQLRTFGAQLGMQQRLMGAYKRCLDDEPHFTDHRYILVDLTPNVPPLLRVRSHVHQPIQYCYG